MKRLHTHKSLLRSKILIASAIISSLSLFGQQSVNSPKGWAIKDPFKSEVFIENNGQFDYVDGQSMENVKYAINNGNFKMYFSSSGLSYHVVNIELKPQYANEKEEVFEKVERCLQKYGKQNESLKKYFNDKSAYVNIEWLGANPDARIIVSEEVHDVYSFLAKNENGGSRSVIARAYKKLTYKDIYPNIDIEYYFPENNDKLGVEYNVIVHPGGDLSRVKMKYNGIQSISMDENGNMVALIPDGNITDHAPALSFVGNEGNKVHAKFILQDQTVSFDVPQYDHTQELVIDPFTTVWSVSPGFTSTNDGYTIRIDYNHNVYVMGGGVKNAGGFTPSYNYQVKKFNPAGVVQWTATGLASTNLGAYGDMIVLRDGKAIVGMGIGAGNTGYILASSNGAITTKAVPTVNEFGWRLCYNNTLNNGVLWAGGGSNNGAHLIKTDTNLATGSINCPWTTASNTEDICYLAEDKAGSFVYITNSTNTSPNSSTTAPKFCKASTATPGTAVWKVNEPSLMMELGQGSFINNGAAAFARGWATGVNGMVLCNNNIYTYDGLNIRCYDPSNGSIINSTTSGGTFDKYSGVDVDNCCRLYVGVNGVVKRYSSALVFDISIPVTGNVFDLQLDPLDDKILYITGKNFVQKISMYCPTCINTTQTNISGCTLGTATVTVTDPAATTPFTYSWSNGGNTQTISGLTAGTYYVTVTDGAACPLTWKDTITITGTFISCGPTVTATGGAVCAGACMSLTATGASTPGPFTYAWNPGSGTGSSFSVCPATTTTYTVVATDGAGATASTTAKVTVNIKPTITLSSASVCPGACATVTAGGGVSYTWSAPLSGTGSTQSACPAATTTYTVTGTDANGCTNTATATVTVNPLPTITVTSPTICKDSVGSVTASGGVSYTWSCSSGTGATISPNTSVIGVSTCTVTGTDANGCKNTATSTITIKDCSKPSVTIANAAICTGSCYNITAVGTGGVGTLTYAWNPNIGTGAGPFSVCPTATTSYTVTVTDGNGVTGSGAATVTVNPLPTITATSATICNGSCANITASGAGTGTYTWATLGSGATQNVCPTNTSTYTVTGTDANGCSNTATTTVTVNPIPVISVPNASICPGGSTTLTATGGTTYTWSPGTGLSATTGATVTANPTTTTTYTVCGVSASGCSSCTTVTVTVGALVATTGPNVTICNGACTNLTSGGGTIFNWSPAAGLNNTTIANPTACPTVTTTYTVNVSDGTCSDDAVVTVTVNPNPQPTITGTTTICSGSSTTLTANAGGNYSWSPGGQTTPSITVSPTNPSNTYIVTVTTNGCTGSASAVVTVNPTPAPTITGITNICTGGSTTLTASTAGPYSWSPGGETTASITVSPTQPSTTYVVSVTVNGCTGTAAQTVTVTPPVVATISGNNICKGDNVTLTGGGSPAGITYSWSTGASTKTITDAPSGTTTYTLVTAIGNCKDTATYTVVVNPLPTALASGDTTIDYGSSTPLKSSGGGTYSWVPPTGLSCTNCQNPTATPTATTQYCVIVKDTAGCSDSSCVTVHVILKCGFEGEVFVPNGFSPNGDGQNDVLYVRGRGITGMYWVIYDRWGEKVFETTNPKDGWDGTYKGKQLDPAVFVYYLKATCITGDEIQQKGNVAIIK